MWRNELLNHKTCSPTQSFKKKSTGELYGDLPLRLWTFSAFSSGQQKTESIIKNGKAFLEMTFLESVQKKSRLMHHPICNVLFYFFKKYNTYFWFFVHCIQYIYQSQRFFFQITFIGMTKIFFEMDITYVCMYSLFIVRCIC